MGKLLVDYVVVALLATCLGAVLGWKLHPDGVELRHFQGAVVHVDSSQTAIAIQTTEYGKVAGPLVHDGRPLKDGQTVEGLLYGPDPQVIQVD